MEKLEPLRLAIERSCDIRPEFRDDCLAFYKPLPVWSFDSKLATDSGYCSLHRPDSTTIVLQHRATTAELSGACYSATFVVHESGWKLASADLDKTCE